MLILFICAIACFLLVFIGFKMPMLILFICAIVGLLLIFIGFKIPNFSSDIDTIIAVSGILLFTCSFGMLILKPFGTIIDDEQELEDLTETTIEENYKDCAFIEDNQFYSEGKLYQYRWDKSKSKVIITCKDDDEKEIDCFKLDN